MTKFIMKNFHRLPKEAKIFNAKVFCIKFLMVDSPNCSTFTNNGKTKAHNQNKWPLLYIQCNNSCCLLQPTINPSKLSYKCNIYTHGTLQKSIISYVTAWIWGKPASMHNYKYLETVILIIWSIVTMYTYLRKENIYLHAICHNSVVIPNLTMYQLLNG